VALHLVDVGVAGDLSAAPRAPVVPLRSCRVRAGTRNATLEPALTRAEASAAIEVGARMADELAAGGCGLLAVGEIGIGNTTAAAALIAALTGRGPEDVVGAGTGIDEATRARKREVVARTLERHRRQLSDPLGALAAVGGLEIAAIVGFLLESARRRIPVVLDGVVTNAAALVAAAMAPALPPYLLAAHRSPEPGAAIALGALGLDPVLALGMRLGEGTGAALGVQLVRAAVAAQDSMATFETAGIVGRGGLPGRAPAG